MPRLVHESDQTQLLLDGNPFIILGGQAGNSSASSLEDIEVVYRALDAVHANTAEIPLSWNLLGANRGGSTSSLWMALLKGLAATI